MFVKNVYNWDKKEETSFGYVIKDEYGGIDELPAKVRNQVRKSQRTYDFRLVSPEEQFSALKQYPNCFFHGPFKSPDDLPSIYSQIDVLLSAYDVRGINPRYAEPNKLYEAIYFDKPIIVSSHSFLADKIARLGIGYDVDPLNEQEVVALIHTIDRRSIEEKKNNIAKINKMDCINSNEEFFKLLDTRLQALIF